MPYLRAGEIDVYFEDSGRGAPIVFAHAFLGRSDAWAGQRLALGARHRVIAYDARGHGRSSAPGDASAYSPELAVADLVGLMDALGLPRAHLCGASMGAETALQALLRHPERAMGVVLADFGPGRDDPERFRKRNKALAAAILERGLAWAFEHHIRETELVASLASRRPRAFAALRELIETQPPHGIAHTLRGVLNAWPLLEQEPRLAAIASPVLVIRGALDEAARGPSACLLRTIPGAEEVVIPDVGHLTNLLAPAAFNRALGSFFEGAD
jgi:2-succinyl-5-enolpyruvyl-6-hydroxy-3-cyclohexene-1-carboxylate synthase/2-succinyl-6-hydroxy-2,4-cyclohexadiene-1-carboxylate synthase